MQTMQIPRCSDAEIEEDLNSSLELLHTDYVDLYFLHRDDPSARREKSWNFWRSR